MGAQQSARSRRQKWRNYAIIASAILLILFLALPLLYVFGVTMGLVVVILLLGFVGKVWRFLARPYDITQWNDVRSVPTGFKQIVERLLRETNVSVNCVWLTENREGLTYDLAEIHGFLPGERQLFVDEGFFELYDADEQRAATANAAVLAGEQFWFYSESVLLLVPLVYFSAWELMERWWLGASPAVHWLVHVAGLGLLLAAGVWIGRQMVYRADRIAAERTSPEAMAAAILKNRRAKEEPERVPDRVYHDLWTRPPPEKRVDRLGRPKR